MKSGWKYGLKYGLKSGLKRQMRGGMEIGVKEAAGVLLSALLLTATGIWACLQTGLYFGGSIYLPAAVWLLGAGGLMLWRFSWRVKAAYLRGGWGAAWREDVGLRVNNEERESKKGGRGREKGWEKGWERHRSARPGFPLLAAGPAVLAGLYVLRLADHPLSMQATAEAALRWGWLAVMAAALAWTAARPGGRLLLRAGWSLIGTLLAYTALAAVYGLVPLPHAVLRTADSGTAAFGARLGGLLQYPNTFGAVMAAFLVLQLLRLAGLPPAAPLRWRLVCSAQALPCGLCLLLSESRGAWLAAAAAWTAAVLTARGAARGRLIACTGWIMAGAVLLFRRLAQAELAPPPLQGLAELAAAGLAVLLGPPLWRRAGAAVRSAPALQALAARLAGPLAPRNALDSSGPGPFSKPFHSRDSREFSSSRHSREYRDSLEPSSPSKPRPLLGLSLRRLNKLRPLPASLRAVLLAAILVAAAGFIPLGSSHHEAALRTNVSTASARLLMYRDSLSLFREAPWFGQGGDVWRNAYRSVQSSPYVGSVMHSSLLEQLMNLGFSGTAVWLAWLTAMGIRLARGRSPWLCSYLVLVLHAFIDFDSSFGLYGLLLVWAGAQGRGRKQSSVQTGGSFPARLTTASLITSKLTTSRLILWRLFNWRLIPARLRQRRLIPAELINKGLINKGLMNKGLINERLKLKLPKHLQIRRLSALRPLINLLAAALLLPAGLSSLRMLQADQLYRQAVSRSLAAPQALPELRRALQLNPLQPSVRMALAARLPQQEAVLLLRSGLRFSPRSPELYSRLAESAASGGDLRAAAWWAEALRLDRFNTVKQTEALRSLAALAELKLSQGKEAEAKLAAVTGLSIYARYEALSRALEDPSALRGRNDRRFYLTQEAGEEAEALNRWFKD
ncbi:O-antigen ligase family protein [Paenibacillus pinistramenti]|uniref:O-antigen ligase family protein n=1 Tax=Paenibacillus pinistramenti TaxID=1768003 RepID=UPI00110816DE|nr:O-antigen ligase family protein [Paenibacillus pinistramenti]